MGFSRSVFSAIVFIAWCVSVCHAQQLDSLYTERGYVNDFTFTDQKNREVSLKDLRGKVWVASFFYSSCLECSKHHTTNMKRLQRSVAGYPDIMLVSFSVYPEQDTPEQLAWFAEQHNADPDRWLFLTGPKNQVYELIQNSFEQGVSLDPEPTLFSANVLGLAPSPLGMGSMLTAAALHPEGFNSSYNPGAEINHTFRFMVVDHRGKIRGYLDVRDQPERAPELAERVKELVQAKYLPSVNASLNGLCAILLVVGYVAIRRRRITIHKITMLSALAVSVLFLACYLYYHFVILHGQPTRFSGVGLSRWVYFGVLLSHTVLAAVVAPLALITSYLGIRNKLKRHVAIARWTLPLWLYVSVTGVVVYWMLYHLYPPL